MLPLYRSNMSDGVAAGEGIRGRRKRRKFHDVVENEDRRKGVPSWGVLNIEEATCLEMRRRRRVSLNSLI